jgi:hypothetical protein
MRVSPQCSCSSWNVETRDNERCADLRFVAVPFVGVEVAEPYLDRGVDGILRFFAIGSNVPIPSAGISPLPLFAVNLC